MHHCNIFFIVAVIIIIIVVVVVRSHLRFDPSIIDKDVIHRSGKLTEVVVVVIINLLLLLSLYCYY